MARRGKYRFLWKIAGDDHQILENCNHGIQLRFVLIGLIIVLLFVAGIVSYHHSFLQIINIPILSWILGFLCALMIFNIYKLNLITISTKSKSQRLGHFFALIVRISFVLLIGLTIIKPLETLPFKSMVDIELAYLKVPMIENAITKTNAYFDKEIKTTENQMVLLKKQAKEGRIADDPNQINYLEKRKVALVRDKETLIAETEKRIDQSTYYIRSIILLNSKFPWVWYISIGFLFLFISPLLLKLLIMPSSQYSQGEKQLFRKIVEKEYQILQNQYPVLFQESIGKSIELDEKYEDPRFNTKPKVEERKIGKEEDFLNRLDRL